MIGSVEPHAPAGGEAPERGRAHDRYKAMISKGRDRPVASALRLDVGPNPYLHDASSRLAERGQRRMGNVQLRGCG